MNDAFVTECANEEEWVAHRPTYLGGSDIAGVLGRSRFRGPLDVYASKVFGESHDDGIEPEQLFWGKQLETATAQGFGLRFGLDVTMNGRRIFRHPTETWAACTPDGFVSDGGGYEGKNTSAWLRQTWPATNGQIVDVDADAGVVLPFDPYCQAQHSCFVTGRPHWYVCALVGGDELRAFRVHRDEDDIALIADAGRRFWFDHVIAENPPEPCDADTDPGEALLRIFRVPTAAEPVALDERLRLHLDAFIEARETEKLAGAAKDYHAAKLKRALGANAEGHLAGMRVVWSPVKGRTYVDVDAIKALDPRLIKAHTKVGQPGRVFSVKPMKEE